MDAGANVSYLVSFTAGIIVFFSPCIFPLIPSYISYLTGISFNELSGDFTDEKKLRIREAALFHSLFFILGFSVVFISLGMTVTIFGKFLFAYQSILKRIGGLIIIFFGLVIMGVLKIGFLQKERKIKFRKKGINYIGSALVGATFALAWTPCVGPVLGSVLVYASSTASMKTGFKLLGVFSLGLAVPFLLTSMLANSFLLYFKKIKSYLKWINLIAGTILIVFGIIVFIGG